MKLNIVKSRIKLKDVRDRLAQDRKYLAEYLLKQDREVMGKILMIQRWIRCIPWIKCRR